MAQVQISSKGTITNVKQSGPTSLEELKLFSARRDNFYYIKILSDHSFDLGTLDVQTPANSQLVVADPTQLILELYNNKGRAVTGALSLFFCIYDGYKDQTNDSTNDSTNESDGQPAGPVTNQPVTTSLYAKDIASMFSVRL